MEFYRRESKEYGQISIVVLENVCEPQMFAAHAIRGSVPYQLS